MLNALPQTWSADFFLKNGMTHQEANVMAVLEHKRLETEVYHILIH